jgi:hypothetical protein
MLSRFRLAALGLTALLVGGCGGQPMAPVSGKVVFNGKPVKDAAVTFAPQGAEGQRETGKPGTGFTDADGNFSVSTFKPYDGALVGTHHVHVMLDDTNPAKCKRTKDLTLEVKPGGNEFTIELDPK